MEQKRVAVVTGANKGIGFEVARQLAEQGLLVLLTARDAVRGREAAGKLAAAGLDVMYQPLDVTDPASAARLGEYVDREHHRLDVLVNNAGVALDPWVPFLELGLETLQRTFDTNVFGAVAVTQALVPTMMRTGGGRIVNVSSALGSLANMTGRTLAYRMSKAALNALTRVLASELEGTGILVNSVCPGWVRTDLGGKDAPVSPEDGARAVVALALLPEGGGSGSFYRDGQPHPW